MEALAQDLARQVPDLADQFRLSSPTVRRNTGFGLFTEMLPKRREEPLSVVSGDVGSVHAMIGELPDPIAFRARMRAGVLMGLWGDSYGQDTRAVDFNAARIGQVFMVDQRGGSLPWEPKPAAGPAAQEIRRPAPSPPQPETGGASLQVPSSVKSMEPTGDPKPEDRVEVSDQALRSGLRTAIILAGVAAVLLLEASPAFTLIAGFVALRAVQTTKGLAAARRILTAVWDRRPKISGPAGPFERLDLSRGIHLPSIRQDDPRRS